MKRLSSMKAGFLRCWQARLKRSNQMRAESSAFFAEHLGLRLPAVGPLALLRFPLLLDGPDARMQLLALSREKGLGVSGMYPTPVHQIEEIRSMFHGASFPSAEAVAERVVTIPTHPLLAQKDKEAICALLDEFKTNRFETKASSAKWTVQGGEADGTRQMAGRAGEAR